MGGKESERQCDCRREQGWPWQGCNRARGLGVAEAAGAGQAEQGCPGRAGRRVAAQLGDWLPQMAFPDRSKLRRPQGFHNPGNGLSKNRRWGRGRASKTPPRPFPQGLCPSPHVLGEGPAMVSGHGQVPQQGMLPTPALPQD